MPMTQDQVMMHLRLAFIAFIAFGGGRHWFTPADAGFITTMGTELGPILLPYAFVVYSNWNTKRIAKDSVAGAVATEEAKPTATPSTLANVANNAAAKVAALLLLALLFMPSFAYAQDKTNVSPLVSSCDPATVLVFKVPFKLSDIRDFITRLKTCNTDDLKNAVDDANAAPIDNAALACLLPVQKLLAAFGKSGLVTDLQAFRRAKQSGLVTGCTNYVNSTIAFQ